jgi:hypothetical protein
MIVTKLIKKYPSLIEPEISLPLSQKPDTLLWSQLHKFRSQRQPALF